MTNLMSGNNLPSGPGQPPEKLKKPKKNDWKSRYLEALDQIKELEGRLSRLRDDHEALQKGWLKPREAVKLEALEHFYSRVLNAQVGAEARAVLDKICEEAVWLIGRNNHDQVKKP